MKKAEIKVGGLYTVKVSGKLTTVRVDAIRETGSYRAHQPHTPTTLYDVTNLTTGRKTTFRSATKFRGEARPAEPGVTLDELRKREAKEEQGADRDPTVEVRREMAHAAVDRLLQQEPLTDTLPTAAI